MRSLILGVALLAAASPAACFTGPSTGLPGTALRRGISGRSSCAAERLGGIIMQLQKVKAPEGFVLPEPKPLTLTNNAIIPDMLKASVGIGLRFATGVFAFGWKPSYSLNDVPDGKYSLKLGPIFLSDTSQVPDFNRPSAPLVIYEYDGSPFCRKVREACSVLALTVEYRPCPGARHGFAAELQAKGGKMTVPYMEDPGAGVAMYESDDIINYLFDKYGPGADKVPFALKGTFAVVTCGIAAALRGFPGGKPAPGARADNTEMQSIEMWGYEGSPFVALVRTKLVELCLPHRVVYVPRGAPGRDILAQRNAPTRFQVPYIEDPNTGVNMYESPDICKYLDDVYGSA
mmetsp:Transcript_59365/g.141120  ORF Transcript_59365/g.141120 Transcript_59365/m.141120 type:complete len:346 (+) Transcript_59365:2-1039(+)